MQRSSRMAAQMTHTCLIAPVTRILNCALQVLAGISIPRIGRSPMASFRIRESDSAQSEHSCSFL